MRRKAAPEGAGPRREEPRPGRGRGARRQREPWRRPNWNQNRNSTGSSPFKLPPAAKLSCSCQEEPAAVLADSEKRQQSANPSPVILCQRFEQTKASPAKKVHLQLGSKTRELEPPRPNQCKANAQGNNLAKLQLCPRRLEPRTEATGRSEEVIRGGCEYIRMPGYLGSSFCLLSPNKVSQRFVWRASINSNGFGCGGSWSLKLAVLLICFTCSAAISVGQATDWVASLKGRSNNSDESLEGDNDILLQTNANGIFKGLLQGDDNFARDNRRPTSNLSLSDNSRPTPLPLNQVVAFLGIRYASAPVKRLRFMPPTAYHYSPNQVHDVRKFAAICPQVWPILSLESLPKTKQPGYNSTKDKLVNLMRSLLPRESFAYLRPLMKQLMSLEQSEDCLNLNIYTTLGAITSKVIGGGRKYRAPLEASKVQEEALPVLVVIHGDSFEFGGAPAVNGVRFARRNKLLVVSLNYRLNILGFPPKLPGAARANLGLMDQVAALHWIRDNIANFGGQPNNITLAGSKQAAVLVNLLMMSPLAKGLFQRALMEDGSALTPLVANRILQPLPPPTSAASSLLQGAGGESRAVRHLRLLARLAECPHGGGLAQRRAQQSLNGTNQLHSTSGQEETNSNALMFECLRDRPLEQIVRLQPEGMVRLNQLTGELELQAKLWSRYLDVLPDGQKPKGTTLAAASQPDVVSIQPSELHLLLARITEMALEGDRGSAEVAELFQAIHSKPLANTASLHPLYAPIVDGTIVPEEEISLGMLRGNSNFAQRHLLIGLSRPFSGAQGNPSISKHRTSAPNSLVADFIGPQIERKGLESGQAVELVNLFVRSFYRFHNQEISNSIVSQYLSSLVASKRRKQHQQESGEQLARTRPPQTNHQHPEEAKAREQQLLVLEALLEAFEDALTSVPLLKTALIHATKQLEPLVEPFLGHQFELWRRDHTQSKSGSSTQAGGLKLLESFITFAQSLYADPNWPLELHSSNSKQPLSQPKATYLYQFDLELLLKQLHSSLAKLEQVVANRVAGSGQELWIVLKLKVAELLARLEESSLLSRIGITCYLDATFEYDSNFRDHFLFREFILLLCDRLGSTVANFASKGTSGASGKGTRESSYEMNVIDKIQQFSFRAECTKQIVMSASSEFYPDHHSVNASQNLLDEDALLNPQNVALASSSEENCMREVDLLALEFLTSELGGEGYSRGIDQNWMVFNVFSQQVATIPGELRQGRSWRLEGLAEGDNFGQDNILAKSSFWSNFVPALNCSRTQPINPLSLLTGHRSSSSHPSASYYSSSSSFNTENALNSTLMNLNLVFTCQLGSSLKTVRDIVDSMLANMGSELQVRIDHWLAMNNKSQSVQNHHSLRMANLSQSNSVVIELENLDNNQLGGAKQEFYSNNTLENVYNNTNLQVRAGTETNPTSRLNTSSIDGRVKYMAVLACCLLVAVLLASLMFRRQKRKYKAQQSRAVTSPEGVQEELHARQLEGASKPPPAGNHIEFKQLFVDGDHQNFHEQQHDVLANGSIVNLNHLEGGRMIEHPVNRHAMASHVYPINESSQPSQRSLAGATCWTENNYDDSIGLCRSHSTLSMSNNSTIVENLHKLNSSQASAQQIQEQSLLAEHQKEVMMSMLVPGTNQGDRKHFGSCLLLSNGSSVSGNGHYGGSSGETLSSSQTTSNNPNISSTMKKRVKIRDPPTKQTIVSTLPNSSYCPVHNHYNNQHLTPEETAANTIMAINLNSNEFYVDESSFNTYSHNLMAAQVKQTYGQQIVSIPQESIQQHLLIHDQHQHHLG